MNDLDKLYKFLMGEGLLRHASYLGQIKKEASSDLIGNDMLSLIVRHFMELDLLSKYHETQSETQRIYNFDSPTKEEVEEKVKSSIEDFAEYIYKLVESNTDQLNNLRRKGNTLYYVDVTDRPIGVVFNELTVRPTKLQVYVYVPSQKEISGL